MSIYPRGDRGSRPERALTPDPSPSWRGEIADGAGTTTTTYLYDHAGGRVKRIVDDGTTVTETIYVMGMEITLVDDTETERTIYYGAGGAFRVIEAGDTSYTQTDLYYRLTDHLGSTSLITDEDGLKVEGSEALYGPFGELRQEPTTTLTDFGYTGQRLDGSTGGLMYYGARYYLPELKRFISADTIVPSAYDSQALNRYAYVKNNPVKLVDPSGHFGMPMPYRQPMIEGVYGTGYIEAHQGSLPYAPSGSINGYQQTAPEKEDEEDRRIQQIAFDLQGRESIQNWVEDHGGDPSVIPEQPCQTYASLFWFVAFNIPMDPGPQHLDPSLWYFEMGGNPSGAFENVVGSWTFWEEYDSSLCSTEYTFNTTGQSVQFEADILMGNLTVNVGDQIQFFGYSAEYQEYRYKHVAVVTGFDNNGMPLLTDSGYPELINQPLETFYNYHDQGLYFDFSMIRILSVPTIP